MDRSSSTEILLYDDGAYKIYKWKVIQQLNAKETDSLKKKLLETYHTCDALLPKKIELEKVVKNIEGHTNVKAIFRKASYRRRNQYFYENVKKLLCPGGFKDNVCKCRYILVWLHIIVKVYEKKKELLTMLTDHSDHLYDKECEREDYRDSMMF